MRNKIVEESLSLEEFSEVIKSMFKKREVKPEENAIMIGMFCRDDQSSTIRKWIEDHYTKHGLDYDMSTFGGIFHKGRTWEELVPPAHHLPPAKQKRLVVFNFTHIGYDEESGKWGRFIRYGHKSCTSSCGAINSLYSSIKERKKPESIELRELEEMMEEIIEKEEIFKKENESNDHIFILTEKLYEMQKEHLIKELSKLAKEEGVEILYFGGIEIDTDKNKGEYNDKLLLKDVYWIDNEGKASKEEMIKVRA